jgi:MFS family permease
MPNNGPSRYRWYVLSLATSMCLFVQALAISCMPVLFSEIAEELDLSLVQIGTVWGATSAAGIIVIMFAGLIGDRFGSKYTLAIACFLAGIFGALRGLADGFISLAVTSVLFGLATQIIPINVIKTVSLWFQGRHLGMAQAFPPAGMGAGFMIGAMISATVLSPWLGGWRHVLFLIGFLSVLIGLLWFLTVREPNQTEASDSTSTPPLRQSLSHTTHIKAVWLVAVAMLGFAGSADSLMGYLPLYLKGMGWIPASADGALAALNAASMLAAVPLLMLSDRLGLRKAVLLPSVAMSIIGTGLLSVVIGAPVWLLVIMVGLFRDMIFAMSMVMIIETKGIGPEYAGTAGGIILATARLGATCFAPLGNSFASIYPGLPFVFWAALAVLALVCFCFVGETGTRKKRSYAIEY